MIALPSVRLGELLQRRRDAVDLDDDTLYQQVTVRLWNKGVVLRGKQFGEAIKTKQQYRVSAGQLLLSRIDVRNGAIGLVPPELDNAIVTNDFWAYDVESGRLLPRYLGWFVSTAGFLDNANRTSTGTTKRIRADEDAFLQIEIPLPPLAEQQRLVARIDALAQRVEEIIHSRAILTKLYTSFLQSVLVSSANSTFVPLAELLSYREPDVRVSPKEVYHFAGVYSFGRGVFVGQRRTGDQTSYRVLTRLKTDNFIYPKLMAWEGALGVVPPTCDGLVVSTEFPVFAVNQERVLPEVLDVYFRMPSVWQNLSSASTGTNLRRRRLNPKDFLAHRFPLPPSSIQLKLRQVKARVDSIQQLSGTMDKEMSAILPSILAQTFAGKLT